VVDVWQTPLEDVGPADVEAGKGGKYLILPPGYNADSTDSADRAEPQTCCFPKKIKNPQQNAKNNVLLLIPPSAPFFFTFTTKTATTKNCSVFNLVRYGRQTSLDDCSHLSTLLTQIKLKASLETQPIEN